MPQGLQVMQELETEGYGGANTALQFSQIPRSQSPSMKNAYMPKIGAIGKRPGSAPLTTTALGASAEYLTVYYTTASDDMFVSSGTTLYKFNGIDTLAGQTMTNPLNKADIYTVPFTDANNVDVMFITDGGNMKQYTAGEVKDVVAAPDDGSPAPNNDLANINTYGPIYCWVYSGHVFVSDGKDIVWYSKRFHYDYFPQTQFERFVRENDYITGPGVRFNNLMLLPMRRGWGILTGSTVDDISGNQYLNTRNGNIAPRSIQRITYPDGTQTIAYLSDDGVYEIYDTGWQDAGSRQYSTRYLMKDKIDFDAIGLTEAQKTAAVGSYWPKMNLYLLSFTDGTTNYVYAYDTRNGEWYPWEGVQLNSLHEKDGVMYFVGDNGHLLKFDMDLYTDWTDAAKTLGTAIHFERYSPALAMEFSGYASCWDYYLVESKQWNVPATLDITVVFSNITIEKLSAVKNEIFVEGVSKWGEAKYANVDYSNIVNEPNELIYHKKAKYAQVLWSNDRDEPVEIYKEKFKGRKSARG